MRGLAIIDRMLRTVATLAVTILAATGMAQEPPIEFENFWWVFLVSGEPSVQFSGEQMQDMQKLHRANLGRLQREKKSVVAGPFEDAGSMRGILIFDRTDMDEVKKIVGADPWVKAGGLEAEFLTLWAAQGAFGD